MPLFKETRDKHWPQGPQAAEWVAGDQALFGRITARDQLARKTEQSHMQSLG